jgi:hypothetical protein
MCRNVIFSPMATQQFFFCAKINHRQFKD